MLKKSLIQDNETLEDLKLKGLYIIQKKQGFRFGMDAVLLGNFARVKKNDSVIDLCTGTGIIPFIISGKNEVKNILGIDIQQELIDMANRTVEYNNLKGQINFINEDLTNEKAIKELNRADVVTVNPPYKLRNSGVINLDDKNAISRHEISCNLDDVIRAAKILLKDRGKFYMVHRPERMADILCTMKKYKIEPKVIRMVQPNKDKSPNLILLEGQKNAGAFLRWEKTLYVYDEEGNYTDEIKRIYGEMGN
ncbi:tRNA1(Val) (adenine(37)-N6)-methyltransferase [Clostridium rectalis]|uniref:tRNA1(Val) (adenine(37)-N6)-methyltransferase n=1 Tax=Clostridium rectalis TaxID=2040295 RepID=UPI000F63FF0A|nr:tRNA1(Val) (adenine(37)-N6)-methyltransferase [Clostridium rectalis]